MTALADFVSLEALRRSLRERRKAPHRLCVCGGPGCLASGSADVHRALQEAADRMGLDLEVSLDLVRTGCQGFCERGPLVTVHPSGLLYGHVQPQDAEEILRVTVLEGGVVERLLYREGKELFPHVETLPFYRRQRKKVLANCGFVDPDSIEDYIVQGGYGGLARALTMEPQAVVDAVVRSGLRGRGGGGFPAGRKWEACRKAQGSPKYILANGDEGDPGAFMDRSLMEGDPHSLVEGMIIGAYAIGSEQGFIYVRNEYPLAVKALRRAIGEARRLGLLGPDILGSGFSFDLEICRGGGAFVCGESTALMASIEGRPGTPRVKYIRSTDRGIWDCPTVLNNVETWANVPLLLSDGVEAFLSLGTEGSPGTKVFSLVGKVRNTGLVEVPMGMTLREIIFDIGGGMDRGRHFKAVQTGGPSGGCLPEASLDLPVDFDSLDDAGSIMGSGGMIVMDDRTCMVDVARYFVSFLVEESCGKCTPCREGLKQMEAILKDLTSGKGRPGDVDLLRFLAENLRDTALCGLGQSAANPVLSTLRYFPEEYDEHEREGFCRSGVCRGLFHFVVDETSCRSCGLCASVCPAGAVAGRKGEPYVIDATACILCGKCHEACPFQAIRVGR
ncbi:4Fe-4S binding protein [Aminithiophilus ramosus]|uniref:4Fe-4S binding protein n=1 Tax=Aminithiophilus ramosus TaxID=3029084 RepID=A0A9Q7AP84_9BACT|nr:NADH-ubiquinone oxidoreductase-F iron-sulfur binding region domain-containing protein [Aminithiophilus ramosus]QTX33007.1 4Fe-4S binding protein [Aminithiophilus ramosus]